MIAIAYALMAWAVLGYAACVTWLWYRDRADKREREAARAVPEAVPAAVQMRMEEFAKAYREHEGAFADYAKRLAALESKVNALSIQYGLRAASKREAG